MKVILSRNGIGDQYGMGASTILPDAQLLSIPIPANIQGDDKAMPPEKEIPYSQISCKLNGSYMSILEIAGQLSIKGKGKFDRLAHLDPDLRFDAVSDRHKDWNGIFGQVAASKSHLDNQGVIYSLIKNFSRCKSIQ